MVFFVVVLLETHRGAIRRRKFFAPYLFKHDFCSILSSNTPLSFPCPLRLKAHDVRSFCCISYVFSAVFFVWLLLSTESSQNSVSCLEHPPFICSWCCASAGQSLWSCTQCACHQAVVVARARAEWSQLVTCAGCWMFREPQLESLISILWGLLSSSRLGQVSSA